MKILLKKLLVTSFIFSMLGVGLYIFDSNKIFLTNLKIYYLKSYFYAYLYRLKHPEPPSSSELAASVPVLVYHGIVDKDDAVNVNLENFKNQMFALKKAGYKTVAIEDLYKFIKGEALLPGKSFLLTFDDGRKDSYYPVDPILKVLDFQAVVFVITNKLTDKNNGYYLTTQELKEMLKSGRWEIQSHGRDDHDLYKVDAGGRKGHFMSNKLWLDKQMRLETDEEFGERIKIDLIKSKQDLDQELGIEALGYAYPFGDFGQSSINFLESKSIILSIVESVYPLAFYQTWPGDGPAHNYPDENAFMVKRIPVEPGWTAEDLLQALANSEIKVAEMKEPEKVKNIEDDSLIAYSNSYFIDNFEIERLLEETGKKDDSPDTFWWLNSGGLFFSENGIGRTIKGNLDKGAKWQLKYAKSSPESTQGGYKPQNIFRLVTKSKWQDSQQEAYFRIVGDNLSEDGTRNESNGLFLLNRFQDADNLYYAGIRVDGYAIIKKKINGVYKTVSSKKVFEGKEYHRDSNPSLLAKNKWLGVRTEFQNDENGNLNIILFVDRARDGNWEKVLEVNDNEGNFGGEPLLEEGLAGLRTDFMDVEFDDYKIIKAPPKL